MTKLPRISYLQETSPTGSPTVSQRLTWSLSRQILGRIMAEVTLGIGSSHSPMLSTPHEAFAGLADLDRGAPAGVRREGARERRVDRPRAPTRGDPRAPRGDAGGDPAAARRPRRRGARRGRRDRRRPERVVQPGQPAGALHLLGRDRREPAAAASRACRPLRRLSYWGLYGDGANRAFPVDAALGRHLVETLTRDFDFDVAHLRVQPRHGPFGHAWSFVHQRLMGDRVRAHRARPAEHVLPAEPADAEALLPARAGHPAGDRGLAGPPARGDRRLGRAQPLLRRRGAGPARPRPARQEGRRGAERAAGGASSNPATPRSATGSRRPARSSTWRCASWTTCRPTGPRPAPASGWPSRSGNRRQPMLSSEDNELLCRVGRGTPMGDLLRQYWMPVPALDASCRRPTARRRRCACSART